MSAILLALVALVAGASAAEYSTTFPYCPCQSKTQGQTYNWSPKSTKKVTGGNRYCYTLTTTEVPGSPTCTNYDLRKIEIDTVPSCAGYIKDITFDGETLARSTQPTPYGTVSKVTRGKGLNLASFEELLKGDVEVCYTLFGECSTEEEFCAGDKCAVAFFDSKNNCCPQVTYSYPPPPKAPNAPKPPKAPNAPKSPNAPKPPKAPNAPKSPNAPKPPKAPNAPKSPNAPKPPKAPNAPKSPNAPKPPKAPNAPKSPMAPGVPGTPVTITNFPYCPCDRTTNGPYSITYKSASKTATGTRYCYDVTAESNSDGKYCSSYDLRKIEFDISLECRGAAKELSYNGQTLAPSFQLFGPPLNGLVFKVGRPYSDKNPLGTESSMIGKTIPLCFTLPDGPCSPLSKFCRNGATCNVAFFSPNNKCCEIDS